MLSLHIFPVRFQVVAPINKLIETVPFDAFFYSLDWHPADHISFIENVANRKLDDSSSITDASKVSTYDTVSTNSCLLSRQIFNLFFYLKVVFEGPPMTEQKMWPAHCVQESWGSELHKELKVGWLLIIFAKILLVYRETLGIQILIS